MAKFPTVRTPTVEEVLDLGDDFGLNLSLEDAESFQGLMAGTIESYHRLDDLAEPKLPVNYPRTTGYRPPPEENRYNACIKNRFINIICRPRLRKMKWLALYM